MTGLFSRVCFFLSFFHGGKALTGAVAKSLHFNKFTLVLGSILAQGGNTVA